MTLAARRARVNPAQGPIGWRATAWKSIFGRPIPPGGRFAAHSPGPAPTCRCRAPTTSTPLREGSTMNAIAALLSGLLLAGSAAGYAIPTPSAPARPVPNGLALTPPMGWNSWNKFGCNVSDQLIRGMADAIVATGMRDAGYQYVTIDDCWQVARDANGMIVADSVRFPHGIKALADYIHSKGLKFGIYTDAGRRTCQGRPGSYGHEDQDARTYAAWGVDYVKVDWCNAHGIDAPAQYAKIRDALEHSGRPIVFSIC